MLNKNILLLLTACLSLFSFCAATNQANPLPAVQKAFATWVAQENAQNYCSKEKCADKGDFSCSMRMSEEMDAQALVWGDINGDGIEDAFFKAQYEQCSASPGTWFVNVATGGHYLIFLSDKEGNYQVLSEPKVLRDHLGVGQITEIKDGVLYGEGGDFSGENTIHEVDITWEAQFKYNGQVLELVQQYEKKKR